VKVVLFGATGMVGQGVLRECLLEPDLESVLAVVRNASLNFFEADRGSDPLPWLDRYKGIRNLGNEYFGYSAFRLREERSALSRFARARTKCGWSGATRS
jgi:hypothetical protein